MAKKEGIHSVSDKTAGELLDDEERLAISLFRGKISVYKDPGLVFVKG